MTTEGDLVVIDGSRIAVQPRGSFPMTVHEKWECTPRVCPVHAPSDHHMRDWPVDWRPAPWRRFERVCPHDVWHPDPDAHVYFRYIAERRIELARDHIDLLSPAREELDAEAYVRRRLEHDCDGCCRPPDDGQPHPLA